MKQFLSYVNNGIYNVHITKYHYTYNIRTYYKIWFYVKRICYIGSENYKNLFLYIFSSEDEYMSIKIRVSLNSENALLGNLL